MFTYRPIRKLLRNVNVFVLSTVVWYPYAIAYLHRRNTSLLSEVVQQSCNRVDRTPITMVRLGFEVKQWRMLEMVAIVLTVSSQLHTEVLVYCLTARLSRL